MRFRCNGSPPGTGRAVRVILTGGLCASWTLGAAPGRAAESIAFTRTEAAGVPVMVITVDMNDPRVKISGMVAQYGCGSSEPFAAMVARAHPTAAVTGTYFSTRSLIPVGDIVVGGRLAHFGGIGTGFCVTSDNQCRFVHPKRQNTHVDWSRYDFVCRAGPRLVTDGVAGVYPYGEGFRDSSLINRATRLAVGVTRKNRLLFVATRCRIYMSRMAKVMRRLGCVDAINLDAGSSLGVYHGGRMLARPGRRMTNLILIYDDRERYERFKSRLTPYRAFASKR